MTNTKTTIMNIMRDSHNYKVHVAALIVIHRRYTQDYNYSNDNYSCDDKDYSNYIYAITGITTISLQVCDNMMSRTRLHKHGYT